MALLAGKSALVTGAASGIGRAAAVVFAREGARVIVADLAAEGGEQTVRAIRDAGGDARFVRCDVSSAAEVEAMVAAAVRAFGRLDCAFNNAGIAGTQRKTADYDENEFDKIIAVDLKGVWLCMRVRDPSVHSAEKSRRDSQRRIGSGPGRVAFDARIHGGEARSRRPDQMRGARIRALANQDQ